MNRVVLGKGCVLEGGVGTERPNDNQIIVGGTGCGKSKSCIEPTLLNTEEGSIIVTYNKPGDADNMAAYLQRRGFDVKRINLFDPQRSNVFYDPIRYLKTGLDRRDLAQRIVEGRKGCRHTDPYWTDGAVDMISAAIEAELLLEKGVPGLKPHKASMQNVLGLVNGFVPMDNTIRREPKEGYYDSAPIDSTNRLIQRIAQKYGTKTECFLYYREFARLPDSTAGCMISSARQPLNSFLPEDICNAMSKKSIRFSDLGKKKSALIITVSPVNSAGYRFANLIIETAIKELLEYAYRRPDQKLPVPVKILFDDFACGAKIENFSKQISIFRSVGISTMILLQSESQLRDLYSKAEATTIINNCSSYVYFFGGRDMETCSNLSRLTNMPADEIANAPVGKVLILNSGEEPKIVPRYDTFNSPEYKQYQQVLRDLKKDVRKSV